MGRYKKDHEMKITFKRVEYASLDEEIKAAEIQNRMLEQIITKIFYDGIASGALVAK